MKNIFLIIVLLVLCSACDKQEEVKVSKETIDPSTRLTKKDSAQNNTTVKIFEGLYIGNINTSTFHDCANPDSTYWVIDETKKLKRLQEKTLSPTYVYQSAFTTLKGELLPTLDEKTREKYAQTLNVKEVITLERKNFNNTCIPYDFWGLGNEPGWSLQISKKEDIIEFYLPGESKIYYFFYQEPREENGVITYSTYNEIQKFTIKILIKKETCSDTMSDRVYEYSVEVELSGGKKYKGCGIKGKQ